MGVNFVDGHIRIQPEPTPWRDLSSALAGELVAVQKGNPAGSVKEIVFECGTYLLETGLRLDARFDGITLRGEGEVRLVGGRSLTRVAKVEDPAVRARLRGDVVERVRVCRLADEGVDLDGDMASRGFSRDVAPSHPELFQNGIPLALAQYPAQGKYLKIRRGLKERIDEWGQVAGALDGGFSYDDTRPASWAPNPHLWVHGYWSYDWADSYERLARFDPVRMEIETLPPHGNYDFRGGQRFRFLNVLEELGEGGDYAVDYEAGAVYFLPLEAKPADDFVLSLLTEPLITLIGTKGVTVEGLNLEATRGHAVHPKDTELTVVRDCHLRNIGNTGIVVERGIGVRVVGNTLHDCGDAGIDATGGDRATLARADFVLDNNHIHHFAKWNHCYQGGINMVGVGITARRNLIHDAPHTAILFGGNEMVIEDNEIHSVVLETGDAGAIYTGRDYTYRGNIVRRNHIHHLGGVGMGTMGVYNDDCVSGTRMEDNFFFELTRALFLGGGRDFVIRNNVFVDCDPCIEFDARGASTHPNWRAMVDGTMRTKFEEIGALNAPYITAYPELADVGELYRQNEGIPPSAVMEGNLFCAPHRILFTGDAECGDLVLRGNSCCGKEVFVDPDFGDFTVRADSKPTHFGHRAVDFSAIGLCDSDRRGPTPFVATNLGVVEGSLSVRFRNRRDAPIDFAFRLFSDVELPGWTDRDHHVSLSAGEEREIKLAGSVPPSMVLDLRSPVAGVRPARLRT